jgi:uncharacterized SAM-binding protein YcdF (DUF218 family)
MINKRQYFNALSTTLAKGASWASLLSVRQERDRHRSRTRCRAQNTIRPTRTWKQALVSTLKARKLHGGRRLPYAALTLPAVVIAAGLWLFPAPFIRAGATWWIISDPLAPGDAVLVLGGGFDRRARAAAALYRRDFAQQVLVAQVERAATPSRAASSESDRSRAFLIAAGVPEAAIVSFGKDVTSTYDEARAAARWAAAHGARHLIVPTDWYHTRRVSWVFRALAPPGVEVSVLALPPPRGKADLADWSSLTMIAREALKYCYYRIRYFGAVREAMSIRPSPT